MSVQLLNAYGIYAAAPAFGLKSSTVLSIIFSHRSSFEADPVPELQAPRAQSKNTVPFAGCKSRSYGGLRKPAGALRAHRVTNALIDR